VSKGREPQRKTPERRPRALGDQSAAASAQVAECPNEVQVWSRAPGAVPGDKATLALSRGGLAIWIGNRVSEARTAQASRLINCIRQGARYSGNVVEVDADELIARVWKQPR